MVSHSNNDHLRPLLFTGSNDTTLHTYKHTYLCLIDVTMHVSHPLYTCMDTKHISARVMTTLISLTHKQTNKHDLASANMTFTHSHRSDSQCDKKADECIL